MRSNAEREVPVRVSDLATVISGLSTAQLTSPAIADVEPLTKADTERREKALRKLYADDTTHWVEP